MSSEPGPLGRDFLRDTEQFLNANLTDAGAAWPVTGPAPALLPDAGPGLSVFVGGKLCLDYEAHIDLPFADWLALLGAGHEKVRHRWALKRCHVGGATHFARTARAKGMTVTLGAALPRKRPRALDQFIDSHNLRINPAHTYDGPMPRTLQLVFADGTHRLLVDAGPETTAVALVPPPNCNVVLLNPGAATQRRPLLSLLRRLAAQSPHITIGIIGRDDWAPQDWHLLQGSGCHVFLNRRELEASLGAVADTDPVHLLTRLRSLVSDHTVTATLGAQGALLFNRASHLTHVPAATVATRRLAGAGDTYCTTAVLAMALNHRFGHAALLASLDAARWVSGRPPATSLAELEEERQAHPEVAERYLPFPVVAA